MTIPWLEEIRRDAETDGKFGPLAQGAIVNGKRLLALIRIAEAAQELADGYHHMQPEETLVGEIQRAVEAAGRCL